MAFAPTYPSQYIPYQPPQPANSSQDGRRWVQGEIGALSYIVTDNAIVTLWDSTDPSVFYEKSTDAYGKPVLKKFRKEEIPLGTATPDTPAVQKEHDDLRKEYEALKKRVAKLERRRRNDEYDEYDRENQ